VSLPVEPVGTPLGSELGVPDSVSSAADLQTAAMRASWWTAVQAVVGLPLGLAVNLVVARSLGPHGYGLLASYMTAYVLILTVLNAGISDATIQWGAAAYARGDRVELIAICRRCAGFHLLVEAPIGAVAAVLMLHDESIAVQAVAAVTIAATMFIGTTIVVLTAMSLNAPLAKLSLAVGLAAQLTVVTAALESHAAGPTWTARLVVSILAPIGAVLIAPSDVRRAAFMPLLPHHWPPGFARYSARILVAGLVTSLVFSRSEILVLDGYGRTAAAGLFALAAGLATQITAPVDAMLGPLVPAAASLLAIGRERAGAAVLRGMRLSALATAPIAMVVIPLIALLTPLIYGGRFTATGALFISLGIVSCLQSVFHPVTAFVTALRTPLLVLALNGGALLLDLALVLALVRPLGATAAVVGNSAGQLASLAGSVWLLRRHVHLTPRLFLAATAPFAALSASVVVASAAGVVLHNHGTALWAATLIALAASIGAGTVILRVGRTVTGADLAAVEGSFPRAARPALDIIRRCGLVDARER
jgi:O-antigen/teichoic acid export membrane protein